MSVSTVIAIGVGAVGTVIVGALVFLLLDSFGLFEKPRKRGGRTDG